jgi:hypothetical protein
MEAQAPNEMMKHIQALLSKNVYGFFYEQFTSVMESTPEGEKPYALFQSKMKAIRAWNTDQVAEVYKEIVEEENREFLSELLTAILIMKTKLLTMFKLDDKSKNVNLKVPSNEHFIHKLLITISHHVYNDPMVFSLVDTYQAKLYKDFLDTIERSIGETISEFTPVKSILKSYVGIQQPKEIETVLPTEHVTVPEPTEEVRVIEENGTVHSKPSAPAPAPVAPAPPAPIFPPSTAPVPDSAPVESDGESVDEDEVFEAEDPSLDKPAQKDPLPSSEEPEPEVEPSVQEGFDSDSDEEYDEEPTDAPPAPLPAQYTPPPHRYADAGSPQLTPVPAF